MTARVLLVNDCFAPYEVGGAERSTRLLTEGLRTMGVDAHVLTLVPPGGRATQGYVHRAEIPNRYWPYAGASPPAYERLRWHAADLANAGGRRLVAEAVQRLRPALVHTNNLAGFSTAAWAGVPPTIPVVHTLRDYYLLCARRTRLHGEAPCGPVCGLVAGVRRRAARRVQAVVGVSHAVLATHRAAGFFADAIPTVIPNPAGVSGQRRRPVRGGPVRLGFLGRLAPEKGVEDLLTVQRRLPSGTSRLSVAGAGDGHTLQKLRRLAGPEVDFVGHVTAANWLAAVDLLVVPSKWDEPFGRVVVEAHAHGVPVVVSRRGGLPELVRDGHDGLVYDPADPDALERTLHAVVADHGLLSRLADGARARVVPTTEHLVERHLELYERVTGTPPRTTPAAVARQAERP